MQSMNSGSLLSDPKSRSCLCSLLVMASLICGVYFIGSAWLGKDYFELSLGLGLNRTQENATLDKCKISSTVETIVNDTREETPLGKCNDKCRPIGSEPLPNGIVSTTSNLEMLPLWGPVTEDNVSKHTKNLLAVAVGIKQKALVNQIVKKFLENDFVVMLFHYDGIVDEWNEEWSDRVIHVSATNQTKWWFSKRFLHPDIVAEYDYIFLWDEDLGVENFHPRRYISIIKEERLEISQPALDSSKSEVHHQITMRKRKSRVHRRYFKYTGGARCYSNSTAPPCVGWVEMMAPVFSRAAWRCVWYMIQNDLIHAWGLDKKLGYCAQGDRMVTVGVVDEEYIVHLGLPTLGAVSDNNKTNNESTEQPPASASSIPNNYDNRINVRLRSHDEMMVFRDRWEKAVTEDKCWVDPFE